MVTLTKRISAHQDRLGFHRVHATGVINDVTPGSWADTEADIRVGDWIIAINRRSYADMLSLGDAKNVVREELNRRPGTIELQRRL